MTIRPAAGFIIGIFIWWFLFMAVGTGFGMAWQAYRDAARFMFETGDFSRFSTIMLLMNWGLFVIVGLLTGWLVSLIGKSRTAASALAVLAFLYMGFNHFYRVWGLLPDWYNIVVPFIIAGSIALGGRLRTGANAPPSTR